MARPATSRARRGSPTRSAATCGSKAKRTPTPASVSPCRRSRAWAAVRWRRSCAWTTAYTAASPEKTPGSMLEKFLREEEDRAREKPRRSAAVRQAARRRGAGRDPHRAGSCCMASGSAEVKERMDAGCAGWAGSHREMRRVHRHVPQRAAGGVRPPRPAGALRRREALRRPQHPRGATAAGRDSAEGAVRAAARRRPALARLRMAAGGSYSLDPESGPVRAFLAKQKEIVLEGRGEMDPLNIEEYRAHGGYAALEKCLRELSPEAVIRIVKDSGLRGRGGAGYPAGAKWAAVRRQAAPKKCIIMNGDEGDPGAFMDRMILEVVPHRVLEGLAIAAYAVGAAEASSISAPSIRSPSTACARPSARPPSAATSASARPTSGKYWRERLRRYKPRVMEGAGAFVCGEETGLIASLEGRRGMPRFRPPYPAESGLWGMPTSVNNVETYANVPWISARRRGVRLDRNGEEQRDEGLRARRQSRARRTDRGADGNHDRGDGRGHRRRIADGQASSRRCRSAARPAAASRRRCAIRALTTRR